MFLARCQGAWGIHRTTFAPLFGVCYGGGMDKATLREIRQNRALSQIDLAKLSGVSAGAIGALERGERSAYPKTRQKLAKALRVPVESVAWPQA